MRMNEHLIFITLRLPAGLSQFVSNLYIKLAYFIQINRDTENQISIIERESKPQFENKEYLS